jgi:hypothetical protein
MKPGNPVMSRRCQFQQRPIRPWQIRTGLILFLCREEVFVYRKSGNHGNRPR